MSRHVSRATLAAMAITALALAFHAVACRGAPESSGTKPEEAPSATAPSSAQPHVEAPPPAHQQPAAPAQQPGAPPREEGARPAPQSHPEHEGAAGAAPRAEGDQHGEGDRRAEGDQAGEEKKEEEKKDEKPRKGLPVTDPLIYKYCSTCHQDQGGGLLGRISFMRKTPEGWEISLKRMVRLQHLAITPEDAKAIVRYLSNDHGLARSEAERAMYEVERRIHWSEEEADKELRQSCGECHSLGRVMSERRDDKEWKLLKATHLAFFPLAERQAFRGDTETGPPPDWESMTQAEAEDFFERRQQAPKVDQADKVLEKLAKDQPLFTSDWQAWQVNRRNVPLTGVWEVIGHEPGRGDVRGRVKINAVGGDDYETAWDLRYPFAAPLRRIGKGLLYSGYSWRGRSQTQAPGEPPELRESLLLSDDWNTLKGRVFTGEYNEIGFDVTLHRRTGTTAIFATENPAVQIPSTRHVLDLLGAEFPSDLTPANFNLGEGVTVKLVERPSSDRVRLMIDVDRGAKRGKRIVSLGSVRGPADVVLYDTIDYVKVTPEQGLSRVGGKMRPPQLERFEAMAMNRGDDDELYTADDFDVKIVPARWSLEEFSVRDNDDDAQFVGQLDAESGVFTPALDGPNPKRRWQANNIGDVFVVATCKLTVRQLPPKPKPEKKPAEKKPEKDGEKKEGDKPGEKPEAVVKPAAPPVPVVDDSPIVMVEKEFRARGHLLVMVPIYVQWDRYIWDQR